MSSYFFFSEKEDLNSLDHKLILSPLFIYLFIYLFIFSKSTFYKRVHVHIFTQSKNDPPHSRKVKFWKTNNQPSRII